MRRSAIGALAYSRAAAARAEAIAALKDTDWQAREMAAATLAAFAVASWFPH